MTQQLRIGPVAVGLALAFIWGSSEFASAADGPRTVHRHDPVEIDSPPIITKLSAEMVRPRRMLVRPDGTIYVADWGAGTVVRISRRGKATLIAEELNEPSGLAMDSMGNLYIATHAQGMSKEGMVVVIGSDGMTREFAAGFSGPTAIALDMQDQLYVANFHDNSISRVKPNGEVSTFVANIPSPTAIVFEPDGNLLALSATEGTVYRITPMAEMKVIARGLSAPSDLVIHPDGHLIAVNFGRAELVHITPKKRVKVFAFVPKGTVAAGFDRHGNLLVANWDNHTLLKITTKLKIKCPHCGTPIPIRLRVRSAKPPVSPSASPKTMPPVI